MVTILPAPRILDRVPCGLIFDTLYPVSNSMKSKFITINMLLLSSSLSIVSSCGNLDASPPVSAQTPAQHQAVEPGDTVSALDKSAWVIFQAKNNNYWFASDGRGAFRYDGKTITNYTTKHGLPNNRIRDFHEDKSGNIFITTLDGISKFDGKTFTTLTPVDTDDWKLAPDDLWFKGDSLYPGPHRYDGTTLYRLKFPKNPRQDDYHAKNPNGVASPYGVYTIYKDSKGHIWFGTAALGVCRYDGKSFDWLYEEQLTYPPSGGSFGIRSIIEDKDAKFWICNTKHRYDIAPPDQASRTPGLISYTRETGIDNIVSADASGWIYYLSIIKHNDEIWMATYSEGVLRYDGKALTRYPVLEDGKPVTTFSIYKDNQGTLWLGTHEAGPYRFNGTAFEKVKL